MLCRLRVIATICTTALTPLQAVPPGGSEFPFEFRAGFIWIQVNAAGHDRPLNFLLDSGANVSAVDLSTVRELGLELARLVKVRGVQTETEGYWPQHLNAAIGGITLPSAMVAVDLRELSKTCPCRIDGLLGADFFLGRVVEIDFGARRVRVNKPAAPQQGTKSVPLEVRRGVLCVPVRVNEGRKQWVRLDTGCASALQWVAPDRARTATRRDVSIGLSEVSIPLMNTHVRIGDQRFNDVSTGLHARQIFPGEAGLLGTGLLAHFIVTIDTIKGRFYLEPVAER